jgi:hypothetical protein
MSNIIKYVRNRNAASNLGYNDLDEDSKDFEEVAIDTVLHQSNSALDLNAAVDKIEDGKRLTSNLKRKFWFFKLNFFILKNFRNFYD